MNTHATFTKANGAKPAQPELRDLARRRAEVLDAVTSSLFDDAPAELREALGVRLERFGSALASLARAVPSPMFNQITNLGVFEPVEEVGLARMLALYRKAELPCLVQVSPLARPEALPDWLTARGLVSGGNVAVFRRGVQPLPEPPTALRVERVGAEWAQAFGDILATVFGAPPAAGALNAGLIGKPGWHCYMAFDHDTPVAVGRMYIHGGLGYMLGAGTLPAYRRRGAQSAILARRFLDAADLGCTVLTMETGESLPERPNASFHNAVRAGFELAYAQPSYVFKPAG